MLKLMVDKEFIEAEALAATLAAVLVRALRLASEVDASAEALASACDWSLMLVSEAEMALTT